MDDLIYKLAVDRLLLGGAALSGAFGVSAFASSFRSHHHLKKNEEHVAALTEHLGKLPPTNRRWVTSLIKQTADEYNTPIRLIFPETVTKSDIHYLNSLGLGLSTNPLKAKTELSNLTDFSGGGMALYKAKHQGSGIYSITKPGMVLKPGASARVVKHELGHLTSVMGRDDLTYKDLKVNAKTEEIAWREHHSHKTKAEHHALGSYQTAHKQRQFSNLSKGLALAAPLPIIATLAYKYLRKA